MDIYNLVSFLRIFILLGFAWLACLMTACIAGAFYTKGSILLLHVDSSLRWNDNKGVYFRLKISFIGCSVNP